MMRSLYSGISGLKNHQTRMDVIGNNVSNVNTTGFKASRTIFQDIFSQTVSAGMANTGAQGGTNPVQIGLGIRLSTIDVMHTAAPFGRTDNPFDMMIENEGFFIVQDATGGNFFTRVGNFGIDNEGYLVSSEGHFVMGFGPNLDNVVMGPRTAATDPSAIVFNPATQLVPAFNGTLIPTGPNGGWVSNPTAVRQLAYAPGRLNPDGTAVLPGTGWVGGNPPQPAITMASVTGPFTLANGWTTPPGPAADLTASPPVLDGGVLAPNFTLDPAAVKPAVNGVLLPGFVNDPAGVRQMASKYPIGTIVPPGEEEYDVYGNIIPPGAGWVDGLASIPEVPARPAWIDFPSVDYWDTENLQKIRLRVMDPSVGSNEFVDLVGFNVAKNGTISIIMNNREVKIAQVGLALFSNNNGLERAGNSLWRESASSGEALITRAGEDGAGTINGGGLEMSNVDLASEFTDMIVTQRGYQANSRIITVSDSLLEELVNLKR